MDRAGYYVPVQVRVVPVREQRLPAWVTGIVGGLSLSWLVATHGPHDRAVLVAAGVFGAIWMLGLLLCFRPKPYVTAIEKESIGGVHVGRQVIGGDARASIAEAKTGASVAFAWAHGEVFVEMESLADAERLVAMTRAKLDEAFSIRVPRPMLRVAKIVSAVLGALACFVLAVTKYDSAVFTALVAAGLITSVLHVLESVWPRRVTIGFGQGLAAAHGSIQEHVLLHASRPATEPKEAPRVRVAVLDRKDEPRAQWLTRLDGLSADAYRGDLPPQADLRALFDDAAAPLDQRVAAARLLARRYSVSIDELVAALPPELVPYFVEVADDDAATVARSIDRLGPVFRAS